MNKEDEIVKELKAIRSWLTGIWVAIMCLMALTTFLSVVANAESAIVSFNDAEHLVALTDSVVGVQDTVSEIHCWYLDGDTTATHFWDVFTCRELVCRTVTKHPKKLEGAKCIPCPVDPGIAIIDYRRVTQ